MIPTHSNSEIISWKEYFDKGLTLKNLIKRVLAHLDYLLLTIFQHSDKIIEIGIGSGAHSCFISFFTPFFVSIDNDKTVLEIAKNNTRQLGRKVTLICADARALPIKNDSFGVCILQGFYEHFEDSEIKDMLREQLRIARKIIFSIPSKNYPRKDIGNERLLSPVEWKNIITGLIKNNTIYVGVKYYSIDPEALYYSFLNRKWLGQFHEIVFIERCP